MPKVLITYKREEMKIILELHTLRTLVIIPSLETNFDDKLRVRRGKDGSGPTKNNPMDYGKVKFQILIAGLLEENVKIPFNVFNMMYIIS